MAAYNYKARLVYNDNKLNGVKENYLIYLLPKKFNYNPNTSLEEGLKIRLNIMKTPYKLSEDTFDNREIKAVKKLLDSKEKLTYGKYVKTLEKIASINERKFCIMFNSGSSVNLIEGSLIYSKKFHLEKGDEVIVPSLS